MADKSMIGRVTSHGTVEVEKGRLAFFAKAIGETDPVYVDERCRARCGASGTARAADLPDVPEQRSGAAL